MVSSVTPSSAMPLRVLSLCEVFDTESCERYAPGPSGGLPWLFSAALSHIGSSSSRSTRSSMTCDGPKVISTSGKPFSTLTPLR